MLKHSINILEKFKNMIISIHQPEHLPWVPFFSKMKNCDLFVFLDNVQYEKNYFQNRNLLADQKGNIFFATVSVKKNSLSDKINEKKIIFPDYSKKYLNRIYHSYCKTPFFNKYYENFKELILFDHSNLSDLNISLILWMKEILNIKTKTIRSSEIKSNGKKSDLVLDICCKLNAHEYVTGQSGYDYLDINKFIENNILVSIIDNNPQIYPSKNFVAGLSAFDLIMNHGPKSFNYV